VHLLLAARAIRRAGEIQPQRSIMPA